MRSPERSLATQLRSRTQTAEEGHYLILEIAFTVYPKNGDGRRLPPAFGRTLRKSCSEKGRVVVPQRGSIRQPRASPEEEGALMTQPTSFPF